MNKIDSIPVSKEDFLDQDPSIRGQNYACVSFLSPEDVIKSKEAYFISAFLENYVSRNIELMNGLEVLFPEKKNEIRSVREQYASFFNTSVIDEEYKSFKKDHDIDISTKYSDDNNFQTSIRGIKIRGTYETLREAEIRAEVLKRMDNSKHNIYIAQVGCWCPWAANPDDIGDAEYTETQLNTLMKEYKKNNEDKEVFYNERKKDLIDRTKEENEKKKKELVDTTNTNEDEIVDEGGEYTSSSSSNKDQSSSGEKNALLNDNVQELPTQMFNEKDSWTEKKEEVKNVE